MSPCFKQHDGGCDGEIEAVGEGKYPAAVFYNQKKYVAFVAGTGEKSEVYLSVFE